MKIYQPPFLLLLLCFAAAPLCAQVVINEYSAANWKQFADNHNDFEDWVELYNSGASVANISGYYLSDDVAQPDKWRFPTGTSIPANGYLLVWCSGRDTVDNLTHFHTNFKFTQTKNSPESIVLSKADGLILQTVELKKTAVHQSVARTTNGSAIWRICTTPTPKAGNNGSTQFSRFAAAPVLDKDAGFYTGSLTVAISTPEPNAVIRYTLDGREPKANSPVYTDPISIQATTVVKARSFTNDPDVLPSFLEFKTFFVNESYSLVVLSVAADTLIELANGDKPLRPVGSIEFFGQDKLLHTRSYGELNSHGQDSWVNDQRSLDWISRDEMGYSKALKEQIFKYSDRDEYQRIIMRAAGDDNYPGNFLPQHEGCAHLRDDYVQSLAKLGGMELDVRASERCVVYLNGEYWGVYSMRELPDDHDYTSYYYNQGKYDLQYLLTWGQSWAEYGGQKAFDDWGPLRDFILNNNMADSAKYHQVTAQLNVKSLIDYFVINLTVVCTDWINYNTGWWRGLNPQGDHKKWGYILWDDDATFGYYINYTGIPNTSPTAVPCDLDDFNIGFWGNDPGKHEKIFKKLQESPEFKQLYLSRSADLNNTVFTCENMLHVLDSMAAVLEPEMPRHAARWGGSFNGWKENVQLLRDYVNERCIQLDGGLADCFNISGPYNVVVLVDPPNAAKRIEFNTLDIETFPWTGQYFGGMEQLLEVKPKSNTGLMFSGWTSTDGSIFSDDASLATKLTLAGADTIIAHFSPISSTLDLEGALKLAVYPTLVSDHTTIEYTLPYSMPVSITLYSAMGVRAAGIPQNIGDRGAGQHTVMLDLAAAKLPPGFYLLDFQAGGYRKCIKLTVL